MGTITLKSMATIERLRQLDSESAQWLARG